MISPRADTLNTSIGWSDSFTTSTNVGGSWNGNVHAEQTTTSATASARIPRPADKTRCIGTVNLADRPPPSRQRKPTTRHRRVLVR
jgi:hypothetical protein